MSFRQVGWGFAASILTSMALMSSSQGAVILSETFTYPDNPIIGQGGWAIVGTSVVNPVTVSSGAVPLTTTGQDVTKDFTGSITSGSGYFGIDVNVIAAQSAGDYFAHFAAQGSTSAFLGRLYARSVVGGIQFGVSTSSTGGGPPPAASPAVYGATLPLGDYRVVLRYDIISGLTNDTVALFVDPISDIELLNTPYIATVNTGGTDIDPAVGLGQFNLRQGSSGNAPTVTVDNLIVATDFASAAIIPEPSTIALSTLAGLGFLGYRLRRKQS